MDPQHLLVKISKILSQLKIPYLVTGGMAVYVWGRPRFTADIDIVIELKKDKIEQLVKTLAKLGYIDQDAVIEALKHEGEFNFVDDSTGIKVDFWILKNDEFDKSRLKRRVARKILGQTIYFTAPEDLILIKLIWYKQSGSSRHLEDIQSIAQFSKDQLDINYLKKWAKLNSLELLEEIINLTP